jgi:XTP/dITP diphosphohydrolase
MRVVLASANAGKLRELTAILAPLGHELVPQSEWGIETPPETGITFVENALLKARYASRVAQLPALADDSGIEVDALGGRPGVYSARYAGEHATDRENLEKMLAELRHVSVERRAARYQCVIALTVSAYDERPLVAYGSWEGQILTAPRGAGGFGYDPIFQPVGFEQTAAELTAETKNAHSHRAQALRSLATQIRQRVESGEWIAHKVVEPGGSGAK